MYPTRKRRRASWFSRLFKTLVYRVKFPGFSLLISERHCSAGRISTLFTSLRLGLAIWQFWQFWQLPDGLDHLDGCNTTTSSFFPPQKIITRRKAAKWFKLAHFLFKNNRLLPRTSERCMTTTSQQVMVLACGVTVLPV